MKRFFFLIPVFVLFLACIAGDAGNGTGNGPVGGTGTPPGDEGSTATSLAENPLSAICRTRGGDIFVSSDGGKPLVSSDGSTFTVLDSTKRTLNGVTCDVQNASATNVWFVGTGGAILFFDGSTLASQDSSTTNDLNAVFALDASEVVAVGNSGTIIRLGGGSWGPTTNSVADTENLFGIGGTTAEMFAVGTHKTIQVSANSGATWEAIGTAVTNLLPSGAQMNAVWVDPVSGDVFIVGNAGIILHRTGANWKLDETNTVSNLLAVQGTSNSGILAVGTDGVILVSDGTTWASVTNPAGESFSLTGVLALTSGSFAVGTDGTDGILLKVVGSDWTQLF
ncbi:MAG: hypothetical protein V1798_12120 [Pseudomonadota bacterium]